MGDTNGTGCQVWITSVELSPLMARAAPSAPKQRLRVCTEEAEALGGLISGLSHGHAAVIKPAKNQLPHTHKKTLPARHGHL